MLPCPMTKGFVFSFFFQFDYKKSRHKTICLIINKIKILMNSVITSTGIEFIP